MQSWHNYTCFSNLDSNVRRKSLETNSIMKFFHIELNPEKSKSNLKHIQIKVNTRLTVVLWALLQFLPLGVFCLVLTDLLVAEVEGLLAPVPMQLQDGNEVPDGSEDGEAQDRVNMDPWVLPCAVGEALILQRTS